MIDKALTKTGKLKSNYVQQYLDKQDDKLILQLTEKKSIIIYYDEEGRLYYYRKIPKINKEKDNKDEKDSQKITNEKKVKTSTIKNQLLKTYNQLKKLFKNQDLEVINDDDDSMKDLKYAYKKLKPIFEEKTRQKREKKKEQKKQQYVSQQSQQKPLIERKKVEEVIKPQSPQQTIIQGSTIPQNIIESQVKTQTQLSDVLNKTQNLTQQQQQLKDETLKQFKDQQKILQRLNQSIIEQQQQQQRQEFKQESSSILNQLMSIREQFTEEQKQDFLDEINNKLNSLIVILNGRKDKLFQSLIESYDQKSTNNSVLGKNKKVFTQQGVYEKIKQIFNNIIEQFDSSQLQQKSINNKDDFKEIIEILRIKEQTLDKLLDEYQQILKELKEKKVSITNKGTQIIKESIDATFKNKNEDDLNVRIIEVMSNQGLGLMKNIPMNGHQINAMFDKENIKVHFCYLKDIKENLKKNKIICCLTNGLFSFNHWVCLYQFNDQRMFFYDPLKILQIEKWIQQELPQKNIEFNKSYDQDLLIDTNEKSCGLFCYFFITENEKNDWKEPLKEDFVITFDNQKE